MKFFLITAFALLTAMPALATKVDPKRAAGASLGNMGFDLFRSLYQSKSGDPIAVSPMSISEALALATYGADKKTREEMESLFVSEEQRKLGLNFDTIADNIVGIRKDLLDYATKSNGVFEYKSATSLWANTARQFKYTPKFLALAAEKFGATELNERDFSLEKKIDGKMVNATVAEVNEWVDNKTNHKIPVLLSSLGRDDIAILLNAIYAKGRFREHFPEIIDGKYTTGGGDTLDATYMTQKNEDMQTYSDTDIDAYSFNVGDVGAHNAGPDQVALDIIVPKDGDLSALVDLIDQDYYEKIVSGLKPKAIELVSPAGKVEQGKAASLVKTLKAAPFKVLMAFDAEEAQFQPLGSVPSENNIYISDIITKTFYEMTPFGFEAAAATAIMFAEATSIQEPPAFEKREIKSAALHVVRHIQSGAPLFIVEYDTPVQYSEEDVYKLIQEGHQHDRFLKKRLANGESIGISYVEVSKGNYEQVIARTDDQGKVLEILKKLEAKKN